MQDTVEKTCLACGNAFQGRVDKKFCSDQCRSTYNNRLQSSDSDYMKKVNQALKRNRRILAALNPAGKNRVTATKLKTMGFDFNYFTNIYTTKEGSQYYFCYEHGYLPIDKDNYLLVVRKEN